VGESRFVSISPDRVLKDIQKPLDEFSVPKNDEVKAESCTQGEVLQTPVTSEALTSLRSLIEQDARILDGPKLANGAQNPSLNVPSFSTRTESCLSRITKVTFADRLGQRWSVRRK
jgi:hypothetical protein